LQQTNLGFAEMALGTEAAHRSRKRRLGKEFAAGDCDACGLLEVFLRSESDKATNASNFSLD
jgi:hypothetical protein